MFTAASAEGKPAAPGPHVPPPTRHRLEVSLADLVTAANAVCGFTAMAIVAFAPPGPLPQHTVVVAGALIIAGGLLDSVDGAVARWRGSSPLGEHLETMSDVVTFGLAPALLFAADAHSYGAPWATLGTAVGAGYVVAALLRLARYAAREPGAGHTLVGLPSPPAAMAATSLVVLHAPAPVALLGLALLAILMIGTFSFPTIHGLIVPFMAFWWVFAAIAAAGMVPPWSVAVFTLVVLGAVLLLIPGRAALRRS